MKLFETIVSGHFKTIEYLENEKLSLSRWLVQYDIATSPPIQLDLTEENLGLHQAFLSQNFTLAEQTKIMAILSYLNQTSSVLCPRMELPYRRPHLQTYLASPTPTPYRLPHTQTCMGSPTPSSASTICGDEPLPYCTVDASEAESSVVEHDNEFGLKPYPYDPAHDPLLPCCPPIVMIDTEPSMASKGCIYPGVCIGCTC